MSRLSSQAVRAAAACGVSRVKEYFVKERRRKSEEKLCVCLTAALIGSDLPDEARYSQVVTTRVHKKECENLSPSQSR